MEEPLELRIGDIKQYSYCPRVVYWSYCLPLEKEQTFKMEHGAEQHETLTTLESRRRLAAYGIKEGKRYFHVPMRSERLGLSGVLDMLVVDAKGGYYPVEFKYSEGPVHKNQVLQLGGYALLVEERFGVEVSKGFIYRIPLDAIQTVRITPKLRGEVRKCLEQIREMIIQERMPPPTPRRGRCVDCEFRRFCGDVL